MVMARGSTSLGSFRLDSRPRSSWITTWSPFPPQLPQESPPLPLCDVLGRLLPRDQFLLGLLQGHQKVSLGLGHQQLSFVHPPGWTSVIRALRENSEKRPIGGDLSVLPFLGWLASGFQPGAADLGQLPAESIAVSESLESWNSRIVRG